MLTLAILVALQAAPAAPFADLIGEWSCTGHFLPSRKPLASDLSFSVDPATGALVKQHADRAPGRYRASELWTAPAGKPWRAAIADPNGMRWYESDGWIGDRLTWKRIRSPGDAGEEFAYIREDARTLIYEWWIERDGGPLAMGDTLTCARRR